MGLAVAGALCAPAAAGVAFQGVGNTYVAVEAENADSFSGADWRLVSTAAPFNSPIGNPVLPAGSNASGAEAILHDFASTLEPPGVANYRFNFETPGTYRLYLRISNFEDGANPANYWNEDSILRPVDFNVDPSTNVALNNLYGGGEGTYAWFNTVVNYTVTAAHVGAEYVDFPVRPRETGLSIDRIILSTNTGLGSAALDALANSQLADNPSRAILYYSFEPPDVHTDGVAYDYSGHGRHGTMEKIGTGNYQYQANAPAVLAGDQSLLLTENGDFNAGRIERLIPTSELDFSNEDWTFAAWFNRADADNDDFILHVGEGEGYGSQNELQIFAHGTDSVSLQHYPFDVDLTASGIDPGEWHHVAAVYSDAEHLLQFYVDGSLVGSDTTFTLGLDQLYPVMFGGHTRNDLSVSRWFDGGLDDVVLWNRVLGPDEIARLFDGEPPLEIIPEPGTLALLAIAGLGFLLFRRRV
jgi:hypothetical protein